MSACILIVEDNPDNLELMSYLLSRHGHTVFAAGDGQQGLEMVRGVNPDLIVCDVQLPDMDGFEIARWLKSTPVLRRIQLVAVTAFAMVADRDRVLAARFDGDVAKRSSRRPSFSRWRHFFRWRSTLPIFLPLLLKSLCLS